MVVLKVVAQIVVEITLQYWFKFSIIIIVLICGLKSSQNPLHLQLFPFPLFRETKTQKS